MTNTECDSTSVLILRPVLIVFGRCSQKIPSNFKRVYSLLLLLLLLSGLLVSSLSHADTDYVLKAQKLVEQQEYRGAVIQLKNALQRNPKDSEARLLLGRVYLKFGDGATAEKELRHALSLGVRLSELEEALFEALLIQRKLQEIIDLTDVEQPTANGLSYRGLAFAAMNDVVNAKTSFEKALNIQPFHLKARVGLAGILVINQQPDLAIKLLDEYIAANPNDVQALLAIAELKRITGQPGDALSDFNAVLALQADNQKALIGAAYILLSQRQFAQAQTQVDRLSEATKPLPEIQYLLAVLSFQQQNLPQAMEHAQSVLRLIPDHLQSQMLVGGISYLQGDYERAKYYLAPIYKRQQPANAAGISKLLAASYMNTNEAAQAISVLRPAALANSDDAQLLALLGSAYLQNGDNSKGQEWLNAAIEKAPDQAGFRAQLALGLLSAGDSATATSELQSAVNLGEKLIQTDVLLVMSYLREGKIDAALQASRTLEQRRPNSPVAANLTGLAYLNSHDHANALAAFKRAIKLDPTFKVALSNIGRLYLQENDQVNATKAFKRILEISPGDRMALFSLAQLSRQAGDLDKSGEWLVMAVDKNSEDVEVILTLAEHYLLVENGPKAIVVLSGLPETAAKYPAVLRLRGMAQLMNKQESRAVHTLQQLVQQASEVIDSHFQLARAYIAVGDLPKAILSLEKATLLDPEGHFLPAWLALAETQVRAKDFTGALSTTNALNKRHPKLASVYEIAAAAQQGKGDFSAAIESYEQVVALEPNSQRIGMMVKAYQSNRQAEKAIMLLTKWLDQQPQDSASAMTLGMIYLSTKKLPDAAAAYELAIRADPKNVMAMNNLAWIYMTLNDPKASEVGLRAYKMAPEQKEIADTYGWILLEMGKVKQALPILQNALAQDPSHPEISYHVAIALYKLDRGSEARPILERILNDNPDTAVAKQATALLSQL